jgi:hypothetical protein
MGKTDALHLIFFARVQENFTCVLDLRQLVILRNVNTTSASSSNFRSVGFYTFSSWDASELMVKAHLACISMIIEKTAH